jgi:nicotinamide riboside kinase
MTSQAPKTFVLTGACCSGKTSIYDHYAQQANEAFVTINEAAREFFETHTVPNHERGSLENQMRIQDFFLSKYDQAHRSGAKTLLGDGSPLCCAAYATLGSEEFRDTLYERIKDFWLPKVTHFFLLDTNDIEYSLDTNDKVRQETPEQRDIVQNTIRHLLEKAEAPFTLISGDFDTRVAQIDAILQR